MIKLATIAAASTLGLIATTPTLAVEQGPYSNTQEQTQGQTGGTTGQTTAPGGMSGGQAGTTQDDMVLRRSSKIVGEDVSNMHGESLGEINDIVIGADGQVSYVAVSSGDVLGLGVGGDLHPVPWRALRWNEKKGEYVLNISKDAFKKAPSFKSDNWPTTPSSAWAEYYRHNGISEGFGATESGGSINMQGGAL